MPTPHLPGPRPKPRRPFTVINPSTNPAAINLFKPSNGTYVPRPQTAAIGGTGLFGAGNPKPPSRFNPLGTIPKPGSLGGMLRPPGTPNVSPTFTGGQVNYSALAAGNYKPIIVKPPKIGFDFDKRDMDFRKSISAADKDIGNFLNAFSTTGVENYDLLPQSMTQEVMQKLQLDAGDMADFGYKWINGQWQQQNSTTAQANAGEIDMVKWQANQELNAKLMNSQRWDPERKRYFKVGQLIEEGKLDLAGNWHPNGKGKKKKSGSGRPPKTNQPERDVTNKPVDVTAVLNTATG